MDPNLATLHLDPTLTEVTSENNERAAPDGKYGFGSHPCGWSWTGPVRFWRAGRGP